MQRSLTPTLAIILAGGLAAGIALARPGSGDGAGGDGYSLATPAAAAEAPSDAPADPDTGYRRGGRTAGDSAAPAAPAEQAQAAITIEGFAFDGPESVPAGTAITVTNLDGAPHTLTFRQAGIDTGTLDGGASATVTAPTEPGTYDFFCTIHPSMEGRIVITG